MEKIYIIALHGFLGRPSDWFDIIKNWHNQNIEWICPDLFNQAEWGSGLSLEQTYYHIYMQAKILKKSGRVYIMGYSMGGRLTLGALKLDLEVNEKVFSGAYIISSNPGLETEFDKAKRIESDNEWNNKILNIQSEEGWQLFLKDWNSQSVFNGSNHEPSRKMSDYNLLSLANAIRDWSLGRQQNFLDTIVNFEAPIHWIVGDRDFKYIEIANRLEKNKISNKRSKFKKIIIPNSSHRVIFDQPDVFTQLLQL